MTGAEPPEEPDNAADAAANDADAAANDADAAADGGDDGKSAVEQESTLERPKWREDLLLLGKIVLVTYVGFTVVGLLFGVRLNVIVSTLETVTFYGAVFGLLALALNLHWGYTGMFNIGIAGFMAVGVYTMSFVAAPPDGSPAGLGLPLPIGIVAGMIMAGLVGLVAALPALRVRADYFAIVTLGLSEIIRLSLLSNALRVVEVGGREYGTGGGSGIRAPPTDNLVPWLLEWSIPPSWLVEDPWIDEVGGILYDAGALIGISSSVINSSVYTFFLLLAVVAVYLLLTRIAYSPFGRVLKAIREDETAARSLGKNTNLTKVKVFVLGCALMGLGGMLWQGSRFNVSPDSFMPLITFYVFVALIVGGSGSNTGSIVGAFAFAAFLWEGPRFLRTIIRMNLDTPSPPTIYDAFVQLGSGDILPLIGYLEGGMDEIRYILVGTVLVVLMIRRPDGLLGHRKELSAATDITRPLAVRADGGEEPTPPEWAIDRSETGDDGGDRNE